MCAPVRARSQTLAVQGFFAFAGPTAITRKGHNAIEVTTSDAQLVSAQRTL
jgi:hypothetical protein